MYKAKFLNYLTIILGLLTIITAFYTANEKLSPGYPILLLILTLIVRGISNVYIDKITNLNKKDKEMLENLTYGIEREQKEKNDSKKENKTKKSNKKISRKRKYSNNKKKNQ